MKYNNSSSSSSSSSSSLPLVSIIMPCYNSEKYIEQSIQSVLEQVYSNWELIICDDGSTDSTLFIVDKFLSDKVKLVTNEFSKGAAGARNTAIRHSRGSYIAFLDSDDIWKERKLMNQITYMLNNRLDFSYSDYFVFEESIDNICGSFVAPNKIEFKDLLKRCDIGCLTVVISRDIISDVFFPFCPKEDYAAWLRILKNYGAVKKSPYSDCFYRISTESISSNKFIEIQRQLYVLENYGLIRKPFSYYYLLLYIISGLYKHIFLYRKKRNSKV